MITIGIVGSSSISGLMRASLNSGSLEINVIELKYVNVGTLGHVDLDKRALWTAISNGKQGSNKSDRKRDRKNRWR